MNKPVRPPLEDDPDWDAVGARIEALGAPPGLEDLTDEEVDAQAQADVAAGRLISHGRVKAWLEALKTDPHTPPPEPDVCEL